MMEQTELKKVGFTITHYHGGKARIRVGSVHTKWFRGNGRHSEIIEVPKGCQDVPVIEAEPDFEGGVEVP